VEGIIMVLSKRFLLVLAIGMKAFVLCAGESPVWRTNQSRLGLDEGLSISQWFLLNDALSPTGVSLFSTALPSQIARSAPILRRRVPSSLPKRYDLTEAIVRTERELIRLQHLLSVQNKHWMIFCHVYPGIALNPCYQDRAYRYACELNSAICKAESKIKKLQARRDSQNNH
jgi:hypothetical protein